MCGVCINRRGPSPPNPPNGLSRETMTPPPLLDDVTERLSNLNMSPSQLQHQMMQMQQMHMQQGQSQMPHMMQQLAPSIVKNQQLNQMTQAHHQQQHFQQQSMMMQSQVIISPLSCLPLHTSTRLPPPTPATPSLGTACHKFLSEVRYVAIVKVCQCTQGQGMLR